MTRILALPVVSALLFFAGCSGSESPTMITVTATSTVTVSTTATKTMIVTMTPPSVTAVTPATAATGPTSSAVVPSATAQGSASVAEESAFLKAKGEVLGSASAGRALTAGYSNCTWVGKLETPEEQGRFILTANLFTDGEYAEIEHLCKQFLPALDLAKGGFTEGSQTVGDGPDEVKPGRYITNSTSDCYWERVSSDGKTLANDLVSFAPEGVKIEIRASDGGFVSRGCGPWLPAGERDRAAAPALNGSADHDP